MQRHLTFQGPAAPFPCRQQPNNTTARSVLCELHASVARPRSCFHAGSSQSARFPNSLVLSASFEQLVTPHHQPLPPLRARRASLAVAAHHQQRQPRRRGRRLAASHGGDYQQPLQPCSLAAHHGRSAPAPAINRYSSCPSDIHSMAALLLFSFRCVRLLARSKQ